MLRNFTIREKQASHKEKKQASHAAPLWVSHAALRVKFLSRDVPTGICANSTCAAHEAMLIAQYARSCHQSAQHGELSSRNG